MRLASCWMQRVLTGTLSVKCMCLPSGCLDLCNPLKCSLHFEIMDLFVNFFVICFDSLFGFPIHILFKWLGNPNHHLQHLIDLNMEYSRNENIYLFVQY